MFETSHSLLVAWGDCLMGLKIIEGRSEFKTRRQHVICSMAWQLDCVAAGVVPFDANHIGVLGLIPYDDDDDDDCIKAPDSEKESETSSNVEMQIIDRNNGNKMYADVLALTETARKTTGVSTCGGPRILSLLSSFALPRMEDAAEIKEGGGGGKAGLLANIFSGTAGSSKASDLVDPHLRWNLEMIKDDKGPNKKHSSPPPQIVVSYSSDVILACVQGGEDRTSTKQQDLGEQQKIAKRVKHRHKYEARK